MSEMFYHARDLCTELSNAALLGPTGAPSIEGGTESQVTGPACIIRAIYLTAWREAGGVWHSFFPLWSGTGAVMVSWELEVTGFAVGLVTTDLLAPAPGAAGLRKPAEWLISSRSFSTEKVPNLGLTRCK